MKIFVVEDDLIHQEAAEMYIEKEGHELAGTCENADEAFCLIQACQPDLVLVDIALPGILNGISLGQKIHDELNIPHIFITSFVQDEIMEQAIATQPKGYLKKPIDSDNLKAAIKIAFQKSLGNKIDNSKANKAQNNLIFTRIGDRLVKLPINEIVYISSDGNKYSSIHLPMRKISCRTSIKDILKQLPDHFIQIHRSTAININYLNEINECEQVARVNDVELPIGRTYRKTLNKLLNKV